MRVFIKSGQDISRQISKKIAPLSARKELEDNIRRERNNAKSHNIQDKAQALKEAKKWQDTLDKRKPEKLSVEAKNAMWKRAKHLKDEFTVGMLSTDELHPVSSQVHDGVVRVLVNNDKMNSIHSVERELAWLKRNEVKVKEYKNIMRHLLPDNPSATDVDKFRGHGRIK